MNILKSFSVNFAVVRSQSWFRRCGFLLLTVATTISVYVTSVPPLDAMSWGEAIFRGVQIIQLSNMSDRQEVALGQEINKQLFSSGQAKLYSDPEATEFIDRIGQRLVSGSSRPRLPYTFQVVDSNEVNAFATMGGFVYVHTGLIKAADNEAQLASVMAHEIGHIAARHALKQMRKDAITDGVVSMAGVDKNRVVQLGLEFALRRPQSRSAELEADKLGVRMLGQAGYATTASIDFMEKLLSKSAIPAFLTTHPATKDRIASLNRIIDQSGFNGDDGLDEIAYQQEIDQFF